MSVSKLERKARPTNLDLQDQNFELHECLELTGKRVSLQQVQMAALGKALGIVLPTLEDIEAGVLPKRPRRRLGGMNPWQVAAVAAPIVTAGMVLYRVIEPALIAFAGALHHGLMTLPLSLH